MFHYSLPGYGTMLADAVRLPAYRRALERAVGPGDLVAEIGTGPGVLAVLACRLGAGHVYAVEPNEAIQVAREVASANGVQDRITFLQGLTTRIEPPQRCQVLVSDLRGCLPLYEHHIATIADARERWLVPGGIQIPQRDVIRGALVESAATYAAYDGPWRRLGMDLEAVRQRTVNICGKCVLPPEALLSSVRQWAELDYRVIVDPHAGNQLQFEATRAGTAHGFALWFETELLDGIGFSNAPGEPELVYGQLFFPFAEPLTVRAGATVAVDVHARLVGDDYVWRWTTEWTPSGPAGGPPVRMQQSSFFGAALTPERLCRSEAGHRPALNADGRLERAVLEAMTGNATLEEIARQLAVANPGRFADEKAAMAYVSELSIRLST